MNNLKQAIYDKGLTVSQLSYKTQIPATTLHTYISGKRQLKHAKYSTLLKLAKALNTSVSNLVGDENSD